MINDIILGAEERRTGQRRMEKIGIHSNNNNR